MMILHFMINKVILPLFLVVFLCSCKTNPSENVQNITDVPTSVSVDLLFEAKIENEKCNSAGQPIDVMLFFSNLTNNKIRLGEQFLISKNRFGSGGNIIPFIRLNDQDIYSLQDNSMLDFPLPDIKTFIEISPHETYNVSIQFYFPREILESRQTNQEIVITPSPGIYQITLVYSQSSQVFDIWSGSVESNNFEVCIS